MSANITTNQTAHSDMNTMAGFVKTFVHGKSIEVPFEERSRKLTD